MSVKSLAVTNQAIDLAAEPRVGGDKIPVAVSATHASPAVFTADPAYVPTNGDHLTLGGTAVPGGFTAGTTYYVVAASGLTFELSATLGGGAINSTDTGTAVQAFITSKDAALGAVELPFKPNNSVVVYNGTGGSLVLQDSDDNSSYGTLATVGAGAFANVNLRKRFIKVSTSATLYLIGN